MFTHNMNSMRLLFALGIAVSLGCQIAYAHEWMAPAEAAMLKNPIPCESSSLKRQQTLYLENCASCHGNSGEGITASETGLRKDTPNLRKRLASHSDGDFFWKISTGKGDMPSFTGDLEDEEIWQIINFIGCPTE
ncbi:c-type cytochrome [Desulfopila aestuarii]|uniref:Cytochrome C oxidase, cbb3-type, subunit III n=1 Tax=Desulfopila aestuarii DSM 18488 TaxID=1121416 RepID=A0A1M7YHY2_9BACT|nr:cytochrome c [Desulfopila aestuarii]SHO52230.1 Cytochrome C oxidase, cbb3-type, subunit III [Desulfopila aestuarii DSM 18488]